MSEFNKPGFAAAFLLLVIVLFAEFVVIAGLLMKAILG